MLTFEENKVCTGVQYFQKTFFFGGGGGGGGGNLYPANKGGCHRLGIICCIKYIWLANIEQTLEGDTYRDSALIFDRGAALDFNPSAAWSQTGHIYLLQL